MFWLHNVPGPETCFDLMHLRDSLDHLYQVCSHTHCGNFATSSVPRSDLALKDLALLTLRLE